MYVRRKVFSVLTDEMGEERLYSVNETLFEGYEYDEVDERIYADANDYDAEIAGAAKGALIAAGALGAGYGAYVGGKKLVNSEKFKNAVDTVKTKSANAKEAVTEAATKAKKSLKKTSRKAVKKSKAALENLKNSSANVAEKGKNVIVNSKPVAWVKNNPKLAAGLAAGTAVAGAAGYGAYKAHQKKNK